MCNLYRMTNSVAEVAKLFGESVGAHSNAGGDVYPGYSGFVIEAGEVRSMVWGFPLALRSKKTGNMLKPKPVNNARTDKLDSSFWRSSFRDRRCLIPVNTFAEAEGARGSMTRTWFGIEGQPLLACAGVWRETDEWGPAYSMIMTDANPIVAPIHNRMPVILRPDSWLSYLSGTEGQAKSLCVAYAGALHVERTEDPWFRKKS